MASPNVVRTVVTTIQSFINWQRSSTGLSIRRDGQSRQQPPEMGRALHRALRRGQSFLPPFRDLRNTVVTRNLQQIVQRTQPQDKVPQPRPARIRRLSQRVQGCPTLHMDTILPVIAIPLPVRLRPRWVLIIVLEVVVRHLTIVHHGIYPPILPAAIAIRSRQPH